MFCSKCGTQNADGSAFCTACGTPLQGQVPFHAAPAKSASETPQFIRNLIGFFQSVFQKKNYARSVADTANDNSFSGVVPLALAAILAALAAMVNLNQLIVSITKPAYGAFSYGVDLANGIIKSLSTWKLFLFSLLFNLIIGAVIVIGIFFIAQKAFRKTPSLSGAVCLAGYAALPVAAVSLLNLVAGLIWFPLTVILELLAVVAFVAILANAVEYAYGEGRTSFNKTILLVLGAALVIAVFTGIAYKCYIGGLADSVSDLASSLF